ncbi:phosphatase PAP2 family protein [Streptomyces sp. NBC_01142]|uniref:phosphatase PAP2 family protein n=1 Tax=Streptomyces sp. NBC_01142 TaxID=2975865 RepID=UPI002259BB66|nr:phosphatase PAP2 family protein [Streptomyces sp. NBC_01142]MCX4825066.1 phosphatase PAP2 family protein [Streptomyces sp. NBC_01142]
MHSPRPAPPTPPAPSRAGAPACTGALFAALSLALVILVAASWSPLLSFDRAVTDPLHRWAVAEPALTRVNRVFSDWVWDPWTMRALIAAAVIRLWLLRERLLAVWIAVTSALAALLQQGLKAAVGRERPQWPDPVDSAHYAAFPSGHAMTAMVTCGLLLWLFRRCGMSGRPWAVSVAVAAVSVAGVGLTRLYLGVHWPSDVLGGWLLGACVIALSIASYERVVLSRKR